MVKRTLSITISSLLLLLVCGPVWAQTTTVRGAVKGTSTAQPVTATPTDTNHTGLDVNIVGGAGSGGTSTTDNSAFTGSTTGVTPIGALYDTTPPTITDGNIGAPRMDSNRNLHVNCISGCAGAAGDGTATGSLGVLNAAVSIALSTYNGADLNFTSGGSLSGTVVAEVSTDGGTTWVSAVFADPTNGTIATSLSSPTSGSYTIMWPGSISHARVRVSAYTTGTTTANLRTTAVNTSVLVYGSDGTNLRPLSTNTSGRLQVDVVSGTVTVTDGAGALNVIVDSSALPTGAATETTLSALNTKIPASPSTDRTTAAAPFSTRLSDGTAFYKATTPADTQPVSAASLPLPTGAATAANQDGIIKDGTGDTTQANVTSGRLNVDGSGVTQPVSGTVTVTDGAGALNVIVDSGTVAATQSGTWTSRIVGNAGGVMDAVGQNATSPANELLDACQFNTAPTTITSGNISPKQCDNTGNLKITIAAQSLAKVLVTPDSVALPANQSVNVSQMGGVATSMNTGVRDTGTQRVTIATNDVVPASQSGTWNITNVSGTISLPTGASTLAEQQTQTTALQLIDNLPLTQGATTSGQSGVLAQGAVTTAAPTYTTGQTSPLSLQTDGSVRVAVTNGGAGGTSATDNSTFTGGSTAITPMGALYDTTPPTITDGNIGAPRMNSSRQLVVECAAGCTAGGSFADNAAFTFGTTAISINGHVFDDVAPNAATENSAAAPRMSANRVPYAQLRDAAGNERGANVNASNQLTVSVDNTVTVGSHAVTNVGTFATQAAQSGTWTVQPGNTANTTPWLVRPHDGTNAGTIKAASTAAVATDTALVVAVSPNNTIAATQSGAWSLSANQSVNVAQINGVAATMGNGIAGTGVQRVTVASDSTGTTIATQATAANLNVRPDNSGATAAAPPARANYVGGLGSGATGGFLTGIAVCDSFVNVTVSSATTTLLVTGVSGRHVRICGISLVTAAANNVALVSGTGATCATGTTGMTGGTTAATGYNFAANGGVAQGSGFGTINQTNATGDSVCVITSAATQLSGRLAYAIY